MITGFRYRIKKVYFEHYKEVYYPQFKVVYSKYDIRNILSFWKPFIEKKYCSYAQRPSNYSCVDIYFENKQQALDFISRFSKDSNDSLTSPLTSPLTHNKEQKKLFKTKIEEI